MQSILSIAKTFSQGLRKTFKNELVIFLVARRDARSVEGTDRSLLKCNRRVGEPLRPPSYGGDRRESRDMGPPLSARGTRVSKTRGRLKASLKLENFYIRLAESHTRT
jgi:hypothetical protein